MKRERGFTLAELIIALAITSILVVLLANVVSATMGAWQLARNRLDTYSNARQVIGRIQDEISAAIAAKDSMEFVENATELQGATQPVPKISENVFFVSPYPNSGTGDLCVIAYRLDANAHRLERAFMDSTTAWAVGQGNRFEVAPTAANSNFKWRAIADGVIEFEIRSYSQDNLDNNQAPADSWSSRAVGNTATEGKTPRRIVLRIKVVDDKSLVRLSGMPVNSTPYNDILKRSAREFFADFKLPPR